MDGPEKVTGRVAPYLDAIRAARAGGWSWREIAARVAPGKNPAAVRAAVRACRYAVEQMPLPAAAMPEQAKKSDQKSGQGTKPETAADTTDSSKPEFDFEAYRIDKKR